MLTAVTGTSVMSSILSKLCRFEILFKNMPKTKAICNSLEPLEVFRKLRSACALRSEVLQLVEGNVHFEPNFRISADANDAFSRMSVLTKPVVSRIVPVCSDFQRMSLYRQGAI